MTGPVLVTGAGGFVGSALAGALAADGVPLLGTTRPGGRRGPAGVASVDLDLADPGAVGALFARVRPSAVVHAAVRDAYAPADGLAPLVRDNVVATANLLDAAEGAGVGRFVQVGSFLEHGPCDGPIGETTPLRPDSPRGATKAAASLLALSRAARLPVVVLRLFSVYGVGEKRTRLLPSAIAAALTGTALPMTPPGFERDLVAVDDVVRAIRLALAAPAEAVTGRALPVGTGVGTTNEASVAAVERVVGRPVRRIDGAFPPRPVDTRFVRADPAPAREALGFVAAVPLDEGIARMLPWVRGWAGG